MTSLQNNVNIIAASTALGSSAIVFLHSSTLYTNLYTLAYHQMPPLTGEDADLFALCATAVTENRILMPLYHGATPLFGGTLAGFKELCTHFGVGNKTFAEIIEDIRASDDWSITEPNFTFVGDYEDYCMKGDFTLQGDSPLWNLPT